MNIEFSPLVTYLIRHSAGLIVLCFSFFLGKRIGNHLFSRGISNHNYRERSVEILYSFSVFAIPVILALICLNAIGATKYFLLNFASAIPQFLLVIFSCAISAWIGLGTILRDRDHTYNRFIRAGRAKLDRSISDKLAA